MPLNVLREAGRVLGLLVYATNTKRRRVTRVNLGIAFPNLSKAGREKQVRKHLMSLGMALLDRVWLWFAPLNTVYARCTLSGLSNLTEQHAAGRAIILLVPHFAGLDAANPAIAGACLHANFVRDSTASPTSAVPPLVTIFQPQRSAWQDTLFRHGRGRFHDALQYTRHDGIRPVIKAMKAGRWYYCLPDNDFGATDAVFVPFFGKDCATLTVLPRLAKMMNAAVIPVITRMNATGYHTEILPEMTAFHTLETEAACTMLNAHIEAWIAPCPEQYLFSHRRYKTRPPGEPNEERNVY